MTRGVSKQGEIWFKEGDEEVSLEQRPLSTVWGSLACLYLAAAVVWSLYVYSSRLVQVKQKTKNKNKSISPTCSEDGMQHDPCLYVVSTKFFSFHG